MTILKGRWSVAKPLPIKTWIHRFPMEIVILIAFHQSPIERKSNEVNVLYLKK
jgi:hypothetical protein